jgi:hypothetical protein
MMRFEAVGGDQSAASQSGAGAPHSKAAFGRRAAVAVYGLRRRGRRFAVRRCRTVVVVSWKRAGQVYPPEAGPAAKCGLCAGSTFGRLPLPFAVRSAFRNPHSAFASSRFQFIWPGADAPQKAEIPGVKTESLRAFRSETGKSGHVLPYPF